MACSFLLRPCKNVGVRDCSAGGRDNVEALPTAERTSCGGTSMFVAKGTESGLGKDFRKIGVCCEGPWLFGLIVSRRRGGWR